MIKRLLSLALILAVGQSIAQVEIYNEDFQSGIPVTFTIVDNDGLTPDASVSEYTSAWIPVIDPLNALDTVAGSTSFFSPAGRADRWLITPPIVLGTYGNILYWEARSHDPSFPDDYTVLVSTTDTQLASFTDTILNLVNELATWQSRSINLSDSLLDNQTVHIAFVNRTNDGFKLYIDDIRVVMEDPVGLFENEIAELKVFPNPATDVINISGLESLISVEIYSIGGSLVHKSDDATVDISGLESGRYFLVARNENTVARTMIVKR
ncbi:MAG: choice-of-anchor J domain-containing protein [Fluviicola sp.]|nr:choice-of-anchor J domain-containing protein [Fluviicola sp.]